VSRLYHGAAACCLQGHAPTTVLGGCALGDAAAAAMHVSDNVLVCQFPQLGKLLCVVGDGELQGGERGVKA
jgi:hypothetical protein